ncbi:hypothetical protein L7F22_007358 [Adiantum nelumboides]|nr:hypothetical protein [Adiantum nelumboides]
MEKEKQLKFMEQKLKIMKDKMLQAQNELKELKDHIKALSMEVASSHKTLADKEKQLEKIIKDKELIEQGMMSKYLVHCLQDIANPEGTITLEISDAQEWTNRVRTDLEDKEDADDDDDDGEEQQIEGTSEQDPGSDDDDDDQDDPPSGTRPSSGGLPQNHQTLPIPSQSHLHQHPKEEAKKIWVQLAMEQPQETSESVQMDAWVVNGRTFARKIKNPSYPAENLIQCPSCGHDIDKREVMPEWPGLPAGVKFDPTDIEILEHLAAQVATNGSQPHPYIDEFIPTLTEDDGICYTHPEKLPGIRRDGTSTHFFHRPTRAYTTGTRKRRKVHSHDDEGEIRWHKTGKTRPVQENNKQLGCKKIMVLYVSSGKKRKPEKTHWVMHQYHLGVDEEEQEGELVVSKVFYQLQPRQQVVATGKENIEELEQVALEQIDEQSNNSSVLTSTPVTPASCSKGLLKTLSEDVNRLNASMAQKQQVTAAFPDAVDDKFALTEINLEMEQAQVMCEDRQVDSAECRPSDAPQSELSREDNVPNLGSQPFSSSFDAELSKLLCNENFKALSQGDGISDWKIIVAEVCSKLESQDTLSLDKIALGTPPADFLEHFFNSQGSTADWTERLKLWSDSQKMEDFRSLSDFLQGSQPLP